VTGLALMDAASLRSFAEILSSPVAFDSFNFASSLRTKRVSTA